MGLLGHTNSVDLDLLFLPGRVHYLMRRTPGRYTDYGLYLAPQVRAFPVTDYRGNPTPERLSRYLLLHPKLLPEPRNRLVKELLGWGGVMFILNRIRSMTKVEPGEATMGFMFFKFARPGCSKRLE
jgi:hypothetical protein